SGRLHQRRHTRRALRARLHSPRAERAPTTDLRLLALPGECSKRDTRSRRSRELEPGTVLRDPELEAPILRPVIEGPVRGVIAGGRTPEVVRPCRIGWNLRLLACISLAPELPVDVSWHQLFAIDRF